jgi:hypothetical protein
VFEPVNHFTVFGRAKAQIFEKCPSVLLFLHGQNHDLEDRLLGGRDELWAIAALAFSHALSNWLWAAFERDRVRLPITGLSPMLTRS